MVRYGNAIRGVTGFGLALEQRATTRTIVGAKVPGTVTVGRSSITITLDRRAIGGGTQFALAASSESDDRPGEPGRVVVTNDYAPDQQWPRPNPRWLEVGGT